MTEFFIASFSGFLGAVFDSFLGSVFQAKYKCKVCGVMTEKEEHCSKPAELISGFAAIDNDVVNIISCAFSAVVATALAIAV